MKVHLTLTEAQADALVHACDLAYRVASGHWRDIAEYAESNNKDVEPVCAFYGYIGDALSGLACQAFRIKRNEQAATYYGIGSDELRADIQRLHAVGHQVRHALAWHRHPEGGMAVSFDKTLNFQPTGEPLPVVEIKPPPSPKPCKPQ